MAGSTLDGALVNSVLSLQQLLPSVRACGLQRIKRVLARAARVWHRHSRIIAQAVIWRKA
jgi:hypothetical protein